MNRNFPSRIDGRKAEEEDQRKLLVFRNISGSVGSGKVSLAVHNAPRITDQKEQDKGTKAELT